MSIIVKKVHGDEYVYFQTYQGGQKSEEYVGRADDPRVWERALALYSRYKELEMTEFRQRIYDEVARRRLEVTETAPVTPTIPEIPESFGLGRSLRTSRKNKTKGKRLNK